MTTTSQKKNNIDLSKQGGAGEFDYIDCSPPKIKRPRSGYILYTIKRRKELVQLLKIYPMGSKDIIRNLAFEWRHLSVNEKNWFKLISKGESIVYKYKKNKYIHA